MSEFQVVWQSDDTPRIAVEQATASRQGRTWTQHRVVVGGGHTGVVVVPVHGDQTGLVRLWRPAVGEERLELPRGFGEATDPAVDARRELAEETGLHAASVRRVGGFDLDTGLVPTPIAVFEAIIDDPTPVSVTDGEVDELLWMPRSALPAAVAAGTLRDGITLAALTCWTSALGSGPTHGG